MTASCFNYSAVANEAGISPDKMREILAIIRQDYPADDMLYELHVLRTCMAIRDGAITIDDALHSEAEPRGV